MLWRFYCTKHLDSFINLYIMPILLFKKRYISVNHVSVFYIYIYMYTYIFWFHYITEMYSTYITEMNNTYFISNNLCNNFNLRVKCMFLMHLSLKLLHNFTQQKFLSCTLHFVCHIQYKTTYPVYLGSCVFQITRFSG